MIIWVDADACPKAIKSILFKAANRTETETILVANQYIETPKSKFIRMKRVEKGFDVADTYIATACEPGDLVITADIPLAKLVVDKGAHALDPRGTLYHADNIGERLSVRNFMSDMRDAGLSSGGPASLGSRELNVFASKLDAFLAAHNPNPKK